MTVQELGQTIKDLLQEGEITPDSVVTLQYIDCDEHIVFTNPESDEEEARISISGDI
jgi:hypothetical protein